MKLLILRKILLMVVLTLTISISDFMPVSDGNVLWMNAMRNGEYAMVTHFERYAYDYLEVTYANLDEFTNQEVMLPGKPTSFTISGCGHYIIMAVKIEVMDSVYVSRAEIPGNINCGLSNTVYLPVISGD